MRISSPCKSSSARCAAEWNQEVSHAHTHSLEDTPGFMASIYHPFTLRLWLKPALRPRSPHGLMIFRLFSAGNADKKKGLASRSGNLPIFFEQGGERLEVQSGKLNVLETSVPCFFKVLISHLFSSILPPPTSDLGSTGISNAEARQPGKAPNFSVNWTVGDQALEVINATTGKDDMGRASRLCKNALYSRWVRLHSKVTTPLLCF